MSTTAPTCVVHHTGLTKRINPNGTWVWLCPICNTPPASMSCPGGRNPNRGGDDMSAKNRCENCGDVAPEGAALCVICIDTDPVTDPTDTRTANQRSEGQ